MPYLSPSAKEAIDSGDRPRFPGELNYAITRILLQYLETAALYKGTNIYTDMNDIIGVLEAVKLEFYRRIVVPYEEKKREKNGDVYA